MVRKGISLALCFILVVSAFAWLLPAGQEKAYAAESEKEYDDELSNAKLYEKWTEQDEPDDFISIKDGPDVADPYGYGAGVPFYMNKQSELIVYGTNNMYHDKTTKRQIKSYDLTSPLSTGDLLAGQKINRTYDLPQGSDGTQTKPLSYVKMTAFDPEGTGRKDHLAVLGVYNETEGSDSGDKTLYLLVYNKEGTLTSEYTAIGNMKWLGDRHDADDNCWYFNSGNFLDITAGDYDGNKKDTLVIWGCFDGTGYTLKEVKTEDQKENISVSVLKSSGELLHDKYTASGSSLATGGGNSSKEWVDNKLCCAVETGDLNGDRLDDLVVLSFVDRLTNEFSGRRQHLEMYRPYLTLRYGQKSKDPLVSTSVLGKADAAAEVMDPQDGNEYLTCVAAGLSTGDIDGDGMDEAVIAGMKNVITGTPNTAVSKDSQCYSVDDNKAVIAAYNFEGKTAVKKIFEEQDANDWTVDSIYLHDDDVWPQYGVQCAAINGKGNPELIFVNGDLYSYDSKLENLTMDKYDDRYFDQSDDTMYGNTDLSNTFIASVDAGNFDGNSCGREQVIFTIGLKTKDHERYFMATGMIGGNFVNEPSDGIAKDYSFTSDNAYESSNYKSIYFPGTSNGREIYAFLSDNNALNYCVCAMDNDEDGLLVRLFSKGYTYSDPEILGVLQAAPRYDELDRYDGDRETSYSFSHTVSYEDAKSDSVSFGAGVTHGLEGTLGGYDIKAGYAMEWSQEFTKGFSETEEYSFTAYDEDAVVMYRTPVTVYGYQIKQRDGSWENENNDNIISLSFPGTPAYSIITVDRYNEFAEYYNKTNEEKMKKLNKDPKDAPKLALLSDTDEKKLYLNTGGDPTKYVRKRDKPSYVNVIQKKANAFEASTGATGFSYENEHSSSRTDSMSHGFTFELTIEFGLGIECFVSSSAGAYVSLEYMSGHSHTTTTADAKGVSCSIDNANETAMLDAGFSEAAASSYGFNYQMATWDSPITKSVPFTNPLKPEEVTYKEEAVPVFGYVLSDVKKPAQASIKAPEDLVLYSGYGLSTSGSFRITGDPIPEVTKVSGDKKITYNQITRKLEVAPGLKTGTYPVKLKAANGIPGWNSTVSFRVIVKQPDYSENGIINNVKTLISGLPAPEEMLLSDEVFVKQARAAYDALTDAQKAKISGALKTKLEKAEAQIEGFVKAAQDSQELIMSDNTRLGSVVQSLNDLFNNNKVPTAEQIQDMEDILAGMTDSYSSLTNEQKALVSKEAVDTLDRATGSVADILNKYDKKILNDTIYANIAMDNEKKAKEVRELITDIGALDGIDPVASEEGQFESQYQTALRKTEAARKAYDLLNTQQRTLVSNYDLLALAEQTLGGLRTQRCEEIVSQQEELAYKDTVAKLNKIPKTVKLKSDGAVYAARYAYDRLSPQKRKAVSAGLVSKLTSAEKKIASFRKAIIKNGTAIKKVKGAKKALNVSWKKQTKKVSGVSVTGYEVQVGLNKKFTKGSKTVKVKGLKKVKAAVKKLKAKKSYYVRVRCYTKTGAATYYSKWSKVKKAKTK